MIRAIDSASTFDLARYAEEQLRPLVDQLPGGSLDMSLYLGFPFFEDHGMDWSIVITVREKARPADQGDWVVHTGLCRTSESVDSTVAEVLAHLTKLRARA